MHFEPSSRQRGQSTLRCEKELVKVTPAVLNTQNTRGRGDIITEHHKSPVSTSVIISSTSRNCKKFITRLQDLPILLLSPMVSQPQAQLYTTYPYHRPQQTRLPASFQVKIMYSCLGQFGLGTWSVPGRIALEKFGNG